MNDTTEFEFSVRADLIGKPLSQHLLSTLRDGWTQHKVSDPNELFDILADKGWAIAPGIYQDGVKIKANFITAQIYLADFDNTLPLEEALHNPYLRNYFIGIYTTASHGTGKGDRYRAIGIFDSPHTSAAEYDAAVRNIRKALPGQDPAMGSAQACFGNQRAEVYYFDPSNRLPNIVPIADEPTQPLNQADVRKAFACLRVIPPRSCKGSGTYDDAINVVKVLVHEFGPEKALELINDSGWDDPSAEDWDIEAKIQSVQTYSGGHRLGLGSLIQIARRHASADPSVRDQLEDSLRSSHSSIGAPLQELMNRLLDISCNVDDDQRWSKAKLVEADIKKLGISSKDIQRQKMAMLSARLGLDIAGVHGVRNSIRKLTRDGAAPVQPWLLPNFLPKGKAAMLYGDSGVGKTSIAIHIANAYFHGATFADSVYPATNDGRNVLFIASDGQGDAYDHLWDYAEQSGFLDDPCFVDRFHVDAASEDGMRGPFNFSEVHLVNLHEKLQSGQYGLVFIDSLKASCMGTDFSIDDRTVAEPMRLVQAMCAKTQTTLVWLHHTNKSSSGSSHRAGGSTDAIEIISAAHELKHIWDERTAQGSTEWIVQKMRGSSKRRFFYTFDFEAGVVLHDQDLEPASTGDLILRALYESSHKRLSRDAVARLIGKEPKTLSNHVTHLKSEGLVRMHGKAWALTQRGVLKAKELPTLPSFFSATADF